MNTKFMNSENYKISDPHIHILLLNLSDKIDFKRSDKYITLSNLRICYTWKNIKKLCKAINLKYHLQRRMKNLNYLMGHILYQIFKIILGILSKSVDQ